MNRTLTSERHQTLTRHVDRLQELLLKNQGANEAIGIRTLLTSPMRRATVSRKSCVLMGAAPIPLHLLRQWHSLANRKDGRFGTIHSRRVGESALLGACTSIFSPRAIFISAGRRTRVRKPVSSSEFLEGITGFGANSPTHLVGRRVLGKSQGIGAGG